MAQSDHDAAFENLIRYVQESRGIDFRGYKRTSLRRRIALRMEHLHLESYADYHSFLEAHPQEFIELLNTVLINVTSFFRDADAWEAVKTEIIPQLTAPGRGRDQLRLWSAGCATGEEPYSLAMLLCEDLGAAEFSRRVKIYATDLDEAALNTARHASYQPRDVEGVPEALLGKYFERTNNHYLVNRDLRKAVIFGRHNIVHDAPISRIDLLVCRNLLIYLETETQNTVLPRLHYALVDDGNLFLGKAETQLARSRLFQPVNMKHRLFRKVPQEWRRTGTGGVLLGNDSSRDNGSSLHNRLLDAVVDSSTTAYLAIDNNDVLLFASAGARRMLEVGESDVGRPFQDLSVSYRPIELRSQIDEVRRQVRPIKIEHQEYHRPPAEPIRVTIEIAPLLARDGRPFAVLLTFTDSTRTFTLQQELEAAQESLETTIEELQSANEELETTNEELQSTNEELETTNEELQSTNEELETTNEELRSANEELESTNEELRRHSDEFGAYRNHVDAIMRSLDAGVIVVDRELNVRSWNRWSENAWGLREEEAIGQPFARLDSGFPVHQLEQPLLRTVTEAMPNETVVDALDRRGRAMKCRVRIAPLLHEGTAHGAVILVEDNAD
ncbi:MAG TPA: CheR family methyltransferase [Acetobacteraceae bacterium]|nr:CheR family methyltransferase [Acetobacteraceae bacterium]